MKPIIELHHISKKYKIGERKKYESLRDSITSFFQFKNKSKNEEFWALKDISFNANPGDVIGIIGKNGAGKSTLLKVLSKITPPTTGKAILRGRVASLLEVGTGFHPELTGAENIYLNGAILGMKRREIKKKFDEIVDFAEVEKFLDTPVKHYSSGMYMRLAFAVAAHLDAEILLVDEVLAVGDISFQKKCIEKIRGISKKGKAIIFISHNLEFIRLLSTQALLLEKGQIKKRGSIESVINTYISNDQDKNKLITPLKTYGNNNQTCYAEQISIQDSNNKSTRVIKTGEPWKIEVGINIKKNIKDLVVAISLSTAFGLPIRTTWSNPYELSPGHYSIEFAENYLLLEPGLYFLTLGISINQIPIQYLENITNFEIIPISKTVSNKLPSFISGFGLLLNPMEISIKKFNTI